MTAPAGYSGTPLPQKLGLKDGQRVLFISLASALASCAITTPAAALSLVPVGPMGDLMGCWDRPYDNHGWPYQTLCFSMPHKLVSGVSGIEESLEVEGRFELRGDTLHMEIQSPHDGWQFPENELSCSMQIEPKVSLVLGCGPEIGDLNFDAMPLDPFLRWFPDRIEGTADQLADTLIGCWHYYGGVPVDTTSLCFASEGRLVANTARGDPNDLDNLERTEMLATYQVTDGHIRIKGGKGWTLRAMMDCDIVIVPNSRFRLGRCAGDNGLSPIFVRSEVTQ